MATQIPLTNFPAGFNSGVTLRNLPVLNTYSGPVYWVDSNGPGGTFKGTFARPFLTVAAALAAIPTSGQPVTTIMVKAFHAETITAAGGWTISTTGVRIIGLGVGSERPQITFSTATTASVLVSAAGCTIANIIGVGGIASVANPFNVQAADCTLDIEWRDVAANEALRAILTSAAAVNLNVNLKYVGISGSAVNLNALRLVGSKNTRITIDYFGTANTGVIEFFGTAGVNTYITGTINNSLASTTHVKNIVDTVTGSHFAAYYLDTNSAATDTGYFVARA